MTKRDEAVSGWRRARARPFVLGHRGARHACPENTFAAFDLALTEGADGVELDVRLDGDGRVIVLHDPTLDRVTAGTDFRHVERLSSSELSRVDVGRGERVPALRDVVQWATEKNAKVNVEVKHDVKRRPHLVHEVASLLRGQDPSRFILSSFHPMIVAALVRLLPSMPVAWLVHDRQRLLGWAPGRRILGVRAMHPQTTMASSARVRPWKAEGLVVNVWTVNEADDACRLDALGVDAIISDCPGHVLKALAREREST